MKLFIVISAYFFMIVITCVFCELGQEECRGKYKIVSFLCGLFWPLLFVLATLFDFYRFVILISELIIEQIDVIRGK